MVSQARHLRRSLVGPLPLRAGFATGHNATTNLTCRQGDNDETSDDLLRPAGLWPGRRG